MTKESAKAPADGVGYASPSVQTQTTPAGDEVAENWQKFFATAENWVFQAAPVKPENIGKPSLGAMECMYRAFKARMEAEHEKN